MFLSADELRKLTGRMKHSAQLCWLRTNGFVALQDADGRPLVLRAAVEARMGAPIGAHDHHQQEPNWSALDAATKAD